MIATIEITKISEDDLLSTPQPHSLATGKNIFVFSLKINSKTLALITGNAFEFAGEFYEVMNSYHVQATSDYLKLNGHRKVSNK